MNYGYGAFNIFLNCAKTSTKRSPTSVMLRPQFPYPSKAKLFLQLIQTKQHLYCTITVHLYTHTYKAYSETLIFCYSLYTHIHILMWGAVGSDAVDVGAFGLGADDGAQLTGRN